jgi:hypothetical protein
MIDMGFEAEVQKILDHMPVTNQKPDSEVHYQLKLLFKSLVLSSFFSGNPPFTTPLQKNRLFSLPCYSVFIYRTTF